MEALTIHLICHFDEGEISFVAFVVRFLVPRNDKYEHKKNPKTLALGFL